MSAVKEINDRRDVKTLTFARGTITAKRVILCTNAYAAKFGGHQNGLLPVYTFASMTRVMTPSEIASLSGSHSWALIPADPMGTTVRRLASHRICVRNHFAFRPSLEVTECDLAKAKSLHQRSFDRRFPMLEKLELEYTWGGGSFLYHIDNNQVMVGFVVGLGYTNPYLSPFEEFQRYKTHPEIRKFLEGGKRISYGARAMTAGGVLSLPKFVFPGGALVGDDAGFLNPARIKGSHAAIKSGMLAAQAAFDAVQTGRQSDELSAYPDAFKQSWLHTELYRARNFKQWMSKGLYLGTLMVGIEQKLLGGNVPWTLHHRHRDHEMLKPASECTPIVYPKPDGKLTFDRLSSVFLSNTNHTEHQPAHLTLKDPSVPVDVNLHIYAGPEGRYCPAAVYEFVKSERGGDRLIINAQNCVHCKTCDIKDPAQNIVWVAPEGGGGPNYPYM